jgi:hypothetical protein
MTMQQSEAGISRSQRVPLPTRQALRMSSDNRLRFNDDSAVSIAVRMGGTCRLKTDPPGCPVVQTLNMLVHLLWHLLGECRELIKKPQSIWKPHHFDYTISDPPQAVNLQGLHAAQAHHRYLHA